MKQGLTWVLCAAFVAAGVVLAIADDKEHGAKCCDKGDAKCCAKSDAALKCPISGGKISKEAAADYKGGKVYFCCPGCIGKFKEEKAKYEAKANEQLVQSGQFEQIGCPLSGGKVNPETKIKICGIDVGFCCNGCQGKVKSASAEKQCETVFVKGFDKAFALKKNKESKEEKN